MVVAAMSGKGPLPLIRVPPKTKINANIYIDTVLKPLVEKEIPRLYGSVSCDVWIHHDAAPSHTVKKTQTYAREMKEKFGTELISNDDIPVKSPDISPLDFFGFGFLKQKLFSRRATTLDGLWKILQKLWMEIPMDLVEKVFDSWKRRCRDLHKKGGNTLNTLDTTNV